MKDTERFRLHLTRMFSGRAARGVMLALAIGALGGSCSPLRDHRGYVMSKDRLNQIDIGSTKEEVREALGSPSSTSTIDGQTYYYISSTVEQNMFFAPKVTDRKILAIKFDDTETVSKISNYGLKDGVIFDFISRKTPTRGKELTLIQQMFGNLGKFNKAARPGVRQKR